MSDKPRPYNSQVAPNQKPFQSGRKTATTHSNVPIAEATAGKLYRVRDKDWAALWGENLTHAQATKLKEQVVGERRSKTARVEPMDVPPPDWWVKTHDLEAAAQDGAAPLEVLGVSVAPAPAPTASSPGTQYSIEGDQAVAIPANGVVAKIPDGHELVFISRATPVAIVGRDVHSVPCLVAKGDVVQARPVDPQIADARAQAMRAVSQAIATAPATLPRRYRDTTVKQPVPRSAPPPRDKTVSREPVFVRLGAPPSAPAPRPEDILPSPLKVATETDGTPAEPDVMTDDDLKNAVPDLGGGPTADDLALAQRQRDLDARNGHS